MRENMKKNKKDHPCGLVEHIYEIKDNASE